MAKRIMRIKKRQQDTQDVQSTEEQEVFENPDTETNATEIQEDTEEDFNEQLKKMLDNTSQENKSTPFTEQLKNLAETQKVGSKETPSGDYQSANVDPRLAIGRKIKAPVGNRAPKVSSRK